MDKSAGDAVARRTYAGVLGKIIGVYLGRPVEGWSHEAIAARFGRVTGYLNAALGAPLVVADDDISGTFAFFRTLAEHGWPQTLAPQQAASTWLNQIVPERTILWWGGLGRSTEHTAWLRLRDGVPAPRSGSIALNGQTVAEQIGAQIFIDAFALACPGDPQRAAALARAAASVSHDGLAVEAAAFLAALEALAFVEPRLDALLDAALPLVTDARLLRIVEDVRTWCQGECDWLRVRARIDAAHGYPVYGGNCPMGTNHAAVLMALLMGGDDFARSLEIAVGAGWDTDCNAGNVGCLNGIRLGLDAIPSSLRTPVADRLLVVSALGGACVSDAVRETRAILRTSACLRGAPPEPCPHFAFELPGARQGWEPCPWLEGDNAATIVDDDRAGLLLAVTDDAPAAAVSTPTFLNLDELNQAYATLGCPTLYPTQTVVAHAALESGAPVCARLYAIAYGPAGERLRVESSAVTLAAKPTKIRWTLPPLGGMPIARLGLALEAQGAAQVRLLDVDWQGAPAAFAQDTALARAPGTPPPGWLRAWVPAARHFAGDAVWSYVVSHPDADGLVTIGSDVWRDYTVASTFAYSIHHAGGLVVRHQGMRRYYAALLSGGDTLSIVRVLDGDETVLAQAPVDYVQERPCRLSFAAHGTHLCCQLGEGSPLEADDATFACGGAGFLVSGGTVLASGFTVRAIGAG